MTTYRDRVCSVRQADAWAMASLRAAEQPRDERGRFAAIKRTSHTLVIQMPQQLPAAPERLAKRRPDYVGRAFLLALAATFLLCAWLNLPSLRVAAMTMLATAHAEQAWPPTPTAKPALAQHWQLTAPITIAGYLNQAHVAAGDLRECMAMGAFLSARHHHAGTSCDLVDN